MKKFENCTLVDLIEFLEGDHCCDTGVVNKNLLI